MESILLKTIKGGKTSRPPVWFMRQAGRILPNYMKLKESYSFHELMNDQELASKVTLLPISDLSVDAAILFSDILFALEGLGMSLKFEPGPVFSQELVKENLSQFQNVDKAIEHLQFQKEAIRLTKNKLTNNKSLIGFVGGPYTLLKFAIGKTNKAILKKDSFEIDFLNNTLVPLLIKNIQLQLDSGAELVMIFDSGLKDIDTMEFENIYLDILKKISENFKSNVGYYAKGLENNYCNSLLKLNFAGIGCDSSNDLPLFLKSKSKGFIQGNFDETKMLLNKNDLKEELSRYCDNLLKLDVNERSGWICGLGHGINKDTPEENVHLFIKTIRENFK